MARDLVEAPSLGGPSPARFSWWEGRPRPDSDRDREVAPTGSPPWPPTGGRAVLGPILDLVTPATSDRGLETAPTGLCQSDGWWEGRPRPDSPGGRAVLGPILRLGPFWVTTPWMGITSLIRANANLV